MRPNKIKQMWNDGKPVTLGWLSIGMVPVSAAAQSNAPLAVPPPQLLYTVAQAEASPRGFYCGAVGWISANGDLDLALPIRTAQIQGEQLTYWTGGGITRRSDPAREWAELHLKTRAITG